MLRKVTKCYSNHDKQIYLKQIIHSGEIVAPSLTTMSNTANPNPEILRQILEPLLEDFAYWFDRSQKLLSGERLTFLTEAQQQQLLDRLRNAIKEVAVATSLFKITGHQVGVDMATMRPWHELLVECQAVGMRYYRNQAI
jgi:hypothetical protein